MVYECVTEGPGSTRWNGSAFNCTSGQIRLRHSQFDSGEATGECNKGNITARGIRRNNMMYTSELYITMSHSLMGKTIQCLYHNGIYPTEVGVHTIMLGIVCNNCIKR